MRRSVVLLVVVGFISACGPTVREIVREGVDEQTRPANWEKLRVPVRELAGEVANGVIEAGTSSRRASSLDASIDRFVRTILHAASEDLDAEVSPAMARAVRASVDAALAAILSDGTMRRVEDITEVLTAAAMAGLARGIRDQIGPAIASALETSLGPAMQHVIQHNLGPAMAATLQNDLTPALVDAMRRSSTAAGEGFLDGVRTRAEPVVDRELERLQRVIDGAEQDAHSFLRFVPVAILASVAGMFAVGMWLRHRAARAGRDALHLVTREIGRMSREPAIVELAQRIKITGEGTAAGAFLADHLRAHPSIKLKPAPLAANREAHAVDPNPA
jgi:hypothetical protein